MIASYKFIGGALCLDFVNTVGARVRSKRGPAARDYADRILREKLRTYDDLARWAVDAQALKPVDARRLARAAQANPRRGAALLRRALEFREALYRVMKAVVERWPPPAADLAIVNREVNLARARQRLFYAAAKFRWESGAPPEALDRVLDPIAASASELLSSEDLARVRQCGGEECGWFFLDRSRNGSRQWCDMKECGNRAKVKRFRQKRSTPSSSARER